MRCPRARFRVPSVKVGHTREGRWLGRWAAGLCGRVWRRYGVGSHDLSQCTALIRSGPLTRPGHGSAAFWLDSALRALRPVASASPLHACSSRPEGPRGCDVTVFALCLHCARPIGIQMPRQQVTRGLRMRDRYPAFN